MDTEKKKLLGALIGLARASEDKELLKSSADAMLNALCMAFGDPSPTAEEAEAMIQTLHEEKKLMSPDCAACQSPCGRTDDYDMDEILCASEALKHAKLHLFSLLGTLAAKERNLCRKEALSAMNDSLFLISCTYEAGQLKNSTDEIMQMLENI